MYNFSHDDIVVLGDSFAASRVQPNSWVRQFTETLTGSCEPARGVGHIGGAWWSLRRELLKELSINVPKILVMCHTEPMRLQSEYDFPLNHITASEPEKHIPYGMRKELQFQYRESCHAALQYYKHLFIQDYHIWSQIQWFKELDEILSNHNIPYVIHLHCFPQWPPLKETYVFRNGLTVEEILWDYASDNRMSLNITHSPESEYLNHFTDQENLRLGTRLVDAINNYSNGKHKIGL